MSEAPLPVPAEEKPQEATQDTLEQFRDHMAISAATASPAFLSRDAAGQKKALVAVINGMLEMNSADPIDAVLAAQLLAANNATMEMYKRAWASGHVELQEKYLGLVDKMARTVTRLSEALDRHRRQGRQEIIVRHATIVNAEQAVVVDQIVTGARSKARGEGSGEG